MDSKAKQSTSKDITDRLKQIAFHFEQRNKVQSELSQYKLADRDPNSPNCRSVEELISRIQSEELSILYELVHLFDNVKKYFDVHQLQRGELEVVNRFKPFRVASNFVNVHKHGTRGRNRPSAKVDYYTLFCERRGGEPSPSDPICDVRSLVNYEGHLFDRMMLIEDLIRTWEIFLRYHTDIDLKEFASRIGVVLAQRRSQSMYVGKIPGGVLSNAKAKADERKQLNL